MEEELADPSLPPSNLRCRRNDGTVWECKNWRLHGKSLCQEHFFYTGGLLPKKTATKRDSRRPKSTDTDLVSIQSEKKRRKKGKRKRDDVEGETEGFTKNEDLPEKKKRGRKKIWGRGIFGKSSSGVASIRGLRRSKRGSLGFEISPYFYLGIWIIFYGFWIWVCRVLCGSR